MRKLIWKLYNENMISIDVANALLDKCDEQYMKILIIAHPRTGGTYFTQYLADRYNLTPYHEPPLDDSLNIVLSSDNSCTKIITTHLYKKNLHENLSISDNVNNFYSTISKYKFDKIFLLDRLPDYDYRVAIMNLIQKGNDHAHDAWVYNQKFIKSITQDDWVAMEEFTYLASLWMLELSKKFNITPIYYHDLYYNTNSVNLQGLEFSPDLSKKLRKDIATKTII